MTRLIVKHIPNRPSGYYKTKLNEVAPDKVNEKKEEKKESEEKSEDKKKIKEEKKAKI